MNELPQPLTPADCDLREEPIRIDLLVELAIAHFGLSADEAERRVRSIAAQLGYPISSVGHA